ncbi:MAG: Class II aldolase/adducin family protein [Acetothermia bacterium 64_32]|nr:MAG: Class II aldolase/adducin family protein [Acetothermia bacterium 64_32]
MAARGLVSGSSGNVSLRVGELVLITPSGIPYDLLDPRQVAIIDLVEAQRFAGEPSSEWRMHVSIYRAREDVRAVVHTHSPHATVASFWEALPALHDEGKILFGEAVPVSRHAPPGTWALAEAVIEALGRGKAALIARHGAVAVGRTLSEALSLAEKLEETAQLALLKAKGAPLTHP